MNILWDVDGTLVDTYPAFARILVDVLAEDVAIEKCYANLIFCQER